jgi:hypothetical protein
MRHPAFTVTALAAMVSCAESSDRELFLSSLAMAERAPAQAFERCQRITSPAVSGQCGAVVVRQAVEQGHDEVGPWCRGLASRTWRAECWFMAAEGAAERGDIQLATELCDHTAEHILSFQESCMQHVRTIAAGAR